MVILCTDKSNKSNKNNNRPDPLLHILIVLFLVILVVSIGTIGYRIFGEMEWIDAFHNGALVFTATSEATIITTYNGKIFSSIYNILSLIFVISLLGVILRGALLNFIHNEDNPESNNCDCSNCKNFTNTN